MLGKPVVRGTRITVDLILRKLSEGATEADILDAYPRLTRVDIQAAFGYAAEVLSRRRPVFLGRHRWTTRCHSGSPIRVRRAASSGPDAAGHEVGSRGHTAYGCGLT
jgi:uncharacterized protein (DUF433 family)